MVAGANVNTENISGLLKNRKKREIEVQVFLYFLNTADSNFIGNRQNACTKVNLKDES